MYQRVCFFALLAGGCRAAKLLKAVRECHRNIMALSGVDMSTKGSRKHTYEYPRPALTVDIAIVTREAKPRVLLIQRKKDPFAGSWALPGGFVEENERLGDAARRELVEETGVAAGELEQLYTAGDPGRDPRGWTVSVAYLARGTGRGESGRGRRRERGRVVRAGRAADARVRPRDAPARVQMRLADRKPD